MEHSVMIQKNRYLFVDVSPDIRFSGNNRGYEQSKKSTIK